MGSYIQLTVELEESASELAQLALHEAGALGLEVRDQEAPPLPGVRPPQPGEAMLIASFQAGPAASRAQKKISKAFPQARTALADVPDQDWSSSWKALIKSVETTRLWVGPPWDVEKAPPGKIRIAIEPKMAFGTGDHPTTFLCLEAVDEELRAHPGTQMLDVGTGTGVLAIAARKLGASRAVGVDNDPMSVTLALENAQENGTPEVELSGKSLQQIPGTFGLVVANILANTLVALAPLIVPKVSRRLVLAGVLTRQQEEVEAAYVALGLRPSGSKAIGEWIRLDFTRGET